MKKLLLFSFIICFCSAGLNAAVYESAGSGDWTSALTWNCVSGCPATPSYPGPGDDARIVTAGHTVTLSSANLTVGSLYISSSSSRGFSILEIRSGVKLTVTNGTTVNNATSVIELYNASTLEMQGSVTDNGGLIAGRIDGTATTVIYNGTSSQNIIASVDIGLGEGYQNITISNTAGTTLIGNTEIAGNFTNNGSFSPGTYKIIFSGNTTISGTSTTTLHDIDVTGSLTIGSPVHLRNYMTFGSGSTVDFGGTSRTSTLFTVLSTSADDVTRGLGDYSGATIQNAFITVQLFVDKFGTEAVWRYLAPPLTGVPVSDWDDDIMISNRYVGGDFENCETCTPSLFYYDETVDGNFSEGWTAFPSSTQNGSVTFDQNGGHGRGYSIWLFDEDLPATITMSGGLAASGSVPVSFTPNTDPALGTEHDGWNLVANPYVANIDRKITGAWAFGTSMNGYIYVKDNTGKSGGAKGRYLESNGVIHSTGWTGVVATGQAFWVKADGSNASLSISQSAKTNTATHLYRIQESVEPANVFRVFMNHDNVWDETIIHFNKEATESIDRMWDAPKRYNPVLNLSSIASDGQDLAINSLPVSNRKDVSLSVNSENPKGDYYFTFKGFETFESYTNAVLHDSYLNKTVEISPDDSIKFSINDDKASYGKDRFKITFSNVVMSTERETIDRKVEVYPNPASDQAYIDLRNDKEAALEIMTVEGKVLLKKYLLQGRNSVDLTSLTNGIYIFRIYGESFNYTERIVKN